MVVRQEVEQREDDAERLLHPQEAVKRPLAVELVHGGYVGWVAREPLVGDDMLASVVALRGAVPEQEAALEGCEAQKLGACHHHVIRLNVIIRIGVASSPQLAFLQT